MIISHTHKFIFVHCRKTAGSSVKVSLSRYLNDNDIVVGALEDCFKNNIKPSRRKILSIINNEKKIFLLRFLSGSGFSKSLNLANKKHFDFLGHKPEHTYAENIAKYYSYEWRNYYKFCIVRNPFEKVVSDYHWRKKNSNNFSDSFKDFCMNLSMGNYCKYGLDGIYDNWPMYTIKDKVAMDRVVKFENLSEDLAMAASDIGIKWDGWLPISKKGISNKSYREYYDDQTIMIVSQLYGKEIKEFGYCF